MNLRKYFFYLPIVFLFGCDNNERIEEEIATIFIDSSQIKRVDIEYITQLKGGYLNKQYAYPSSIKLDDNSILTATASYSSFSDVKSANIVGVRSFDDGKSWSYPLTLQENTAKLNISNPSLLKITNKHLLLFFTSKESTRRIDLYFKESFDSGESWGTPRMINKPNTGYYIVNNARVVFENGRIWIPVALPNGDIYENYNSQKVFCFYSDDIGKTWSKTIELKKSYPLMEPGLTVLSNRELLMNFRTKRGKILFARSFDNGKNWNFEYSNIDSPASPQTIIRKYNTDTLFMAWNNTNLNFTETRGNRTPLSIAFSPDKGYNWTLIGNIENSKNYTYSYSYPSMIIDKKMLYLNYYEMENNSERSSLKLAKIVIHF